MCQSPLRTNLNRADTGNRDNPVVLAFIEKYGHRPRLLDLFAGAGGAAMGYHRAGFEVVGVDIKPQPHYPFEFHQADALTYPLDGFDCYHASPPCQAYSIMKNLPWVKNKNHPKLIGIILSLLKQTGKPYIVENVIGSPLQGGFLCGQMFGLTFYRHRIFESSFFWLQPGHPNHRMIIEKGRMLGRRADKGHASLSLDWMNKYEQSQSIPPVYTEYIGKYLMQEIEARRCSQEVMELKL